MKKKEIIQVHHISYDPEIVVKVTRAEHFIITRLSWYKELTAGCKKAIRELLKLKPTKKISKLKRAETHRSDRGPKLFAVKDEKGRFKDIQTYVRAHKMEIKKRMEP